MIMNINLMKTVLRYYCQIFLQTEENQETC